MKTFVHINAAGEVVGIGMIYYEAGGLTEPVQALVDAIGEDAGIVAYGESVCADPALVTVVIDTAQMPGADPDKYDKTFRGAFKHGGGMRVVEDLPKAKNIAHIFRRSKRAAELLPLDIEATIPDKAAAAEAKRQAIRAEFAAIQNEIDGVKDVDDLKRITSDMLAR